ncbi:MAG: glycosyltransferase family 10 [Candidatus Gastranaerophilaceae bacterium]
MTKTVAICTDTEIFNENRMFDYDFAQKYFGLVAMHYFLKILADYRVITGDIALKLIEEKKLNPKDVIVLQEQDAKFGKKLIEKGAFPHTIYCFESQIYAKSFYEKLNSLAQKFKNRIFFDGMYESIKDCGKNNNFHSYFPSYDDKDILEPKKWENRDFASLVMGNKFYVYGDIFPRKIRFKKIVKWAFKKYIYKSPADKYLEANELQNKRLELVEFFGSKDSLKLYGGGWEYLDNLPKEWENRLTKIVKKLNPKPVDNKFEAISNFKFNFCLENLKYKGYITEKIIHSFVVGSIPVYLGAPDVEKYIPKNCFIDLRDFKTNEELFEFMKNLSTEKAQEYIKNGRDFLNSEEGQKYSFKGYAKFLAKLVEE